MAIYIPELKIPEAGQVLVVRADGTCRQYDLRDVFFLSSADEAKAVQEIGPHGDLIDRDAYEYPGDLKHEDVVIPADKEDAP